MTAYGPLRAQLVALLNWEDAHVGLDRALRGLPPDMRGTRPGGMAHSIWEIVEHLRLAQWDILDFSRNPAYKEQKWPDAYWPTHPVPPEAHAWDRSLEQFESDLRAFCDLVEDPNTDLHAPFPHGTGQTLLREALVLADHNAYHVGELVAVRHALGAWS